MKDKGGGNENKNNINTDDEALVESFEHEIVEPFADGATIVPNRGNARNPKKHQDASEVNWDGDAVIFAAENFDGEIGEDSRDEISGKADAGKDKFVDEVKSGATVAKPGNHEKDGESDHQNGDDLPPKTTGELMLDGCFFSFGSAGRFSFSFSHKLIIPCLFLIVFKLLLIRPDGFGLLTDIRGGEAFKLAFVSGNDNVLAFEFGVLEFGLVF